jgi:hypothetical protein
VNSANPAVLFAWLDVRGRLLLINDTWRDHHAKHRTLEKIDAAIAEKNLLKHPFRDWQAGKLSREALQLYTRSITAT